MLAKWGQLIVVFPGLYPTIYFLIDRKFGLLSSKSPELLVNLFWNIFFYTHIILGGIALLIGWSQFSTKLRIKHLALHRIFGKIYIIAVLLSSTAGIYIGFFATGGMVSSLGFISLGIIWFFSTLKAYLYIRNKNVLNHDGLQLCILFLRGYFKVMAPNIDDYFWRFHKSLHISCLVMLGA